MKRVASFLYFFFIMTPALGLGAMIDGVSSNQFRRHFLVLTLFPLFSDRTNCRDGPNLGT